MARLLSGIRTIARQKLADELKGSDVAYSWTDDELDIYIADCLVEMASYKPYEVKETLATTASSRELDLSSIDDLLEVKKVEYPVDKQPRRFRQFDVWGDTLRMELDTAPSSIDDVYLYCKKYHSLSDTASTLNPTLERILVLGVCGQAAVAKARTQINKVNKNTGVAANMQAWGLAQLSLYYEELNKLVVADSFVEYPTD
jgi:hypothetical protein